MIWNWNLQGVLELSFSFYKRKKRGNSDVQNFFGKSWIFTYFFPKIAIFSFARDIWRHNFVTRWPSLLIEVSMVRRDQYQQSIHTNQVHSYFGCEIHPWLDVLQKYVG